MLKKLFSLIIAMTLTSVTLAAVTIPPINFFENKYTYQIKAPTKQSEQIIYGLLKGTKTKEDAFKYAIKNPLSYFTQSFLKSHPKGSEFYSIYLVVESERLVQDIKNNKALSLLMLRDLSFQDEFINNVYIRHSRRPTLVAAATEAERKYIEAIYTIHLHNTGKYQFSKLIAEASDNDFISKILKLEIEQAKVIQRETSIPTRKIKSKPGRSRFTIVD